MILKWQIYYHANSMFDKMVNYDGPKIKGDFVTLSESPEVGVEISEESTRKFAASGTPFFE